jgi:hypothetical protein
MEKDRLHLGSDVLIDSGGSASASRRFVDAVLGVCGVWKKKQDSGGARNEWP